jgi:potassium-transporting ATPase KdpC subunit
MPAIVRPCLVMLLALTFVTGFIYPLAVTGVAHVVFPEQAQGSLIVRDGRVVGSSLLGQPFVGDRYFWSRPSATSPYPYNGAASGGSNLGPTNPALVEAVRLRVDVVRRSTMNSPQLVPVDLVTSSASGLDPHISPAAAEYQVERIASVRRLSPDQVRQLVVRHTKPRTLGVLGEPRVNVLTLNLALDDPH